MALVTVEVIKDRIRVDEAFSDSDLARMADEASGIIASYLKSRFDAAWTPETVPVHIRTAILLVVKSLHDDGQSAEIIAQMDKGEGPIASILRRDRFPTLA